MIMEATTMAAILRQIEVITVRKVPWKPPLSVSTPHKRVMTVKLPSTQCIKKEVGCRSDRVDGLDEVLILLDFDTEALNPVLSVEAFLFTLKLPRDSIASVKLQPSETFSVGVDKLEVAGERLNHLINSVIHQNFLLEEIKFLVVTGHCIVGGVPRIDVKTRAFLKWARFGPVKFESMQ